MTETTDKIIDRDQLQDAYINEMIEACNSRLDIYGYEVTDFLTEPQQYMPASC